MAIICPTVTPITVQDFHQQLNRVAPLADRIQIDLMDKAFTGSDSEVGLDDIWWPHSVICDIHLMYQDPFLELDTLLHLKPHMVIIHVETMIHHMHFAAELHKEGIKAGLAVLPETPIENIEQILHSFDHLLIFSGNLGHFGGTADLRLAEKARAAKAHHPDLEVGWDGGINPENARLLADAGIDVLNVGGFIQKSEDPGLAYETITKSLNN